MPLFILLGLMLGFSFFNFSSGWAMPAPISAAQKHVDPKKTERQRFVRVLVYEGDCSTLEQGLEHWGPKVKSAKRLGIVIKGLKRIETSGSTRKCGWVLNVPLETYVAGVVLGELGLRKWPENFLKVQSVLARSYVIEKIEAKKKSHTPSWPFDIRAGVEDQVFQLPQAQEFAIWKSREQVLRESAGQILVGGQGVWPSKIFFHSSCGGETVPASEVWGARISNKTKSPMFRSVKCPYCKTAQEVRWQLQISESEWLELLKIKGWRQGALKIIPEVESISSEGALQRVSAVHFIDRLSGQNKTLKTDQLRRLVGYGRLKSARFSIEKRGEVWIISGVGNGHGVGLCQLGAANLASRGQSASSILKYYFPGSSVRLIE